MERTRNPIITNRPDPGLHSMEMYLMRSLEPVKPRQEFITGLRGRITAAPVQKYNTQEPLPALILILGGILGAIIIILTGVKTFITLAEVIKELRGKPHPSNKTLRSHSTSLIRSTSTGS